MCKSIFHLFRLLKAIQTDHRCFGLAMGINDNTFLGKNYFVNYFGKSVFYLGNTYIYVLVHDKNKSKNLAFLAILAKSPSLSRTISSLTGTWPSIKIINANFD